jgi:hypothetical protein
MPYLRLALFEQTPKLPRREMGEHHPGRCSPQKRHRPTAFIGDFISWGVELAVDANNAVAIQTRE